MEDICAFLEKLDENMTKNLTLFNLLKSKIPNYKPPLYDKNLDLLASKLQMVSKHIEEYKKIITEIEDKYFCDDEKQFVLAFDGEFNSSENYKKSMKSQILKHKYSEILSEEHKKKNKKEVTSEFKTITLDDVEGVALKNNPIKLPVVENLSDIPAAFYWYKGDKFYKKGIYVSLCKNFYVKVPFPNLLNPSKEFNLKTIKCKYETLQECQANKKKLSMIYGGEVKECFYVHKKEKFNKVGSQYRCYIETFGNHEILDHDLKRVSHFDIKHLLMYSLSDNLLAMIWYQNIFKDVNRLVFTNLDVY